MKDNCSPGFPFFAFFLLTTLTVLTYFYTYWISLHQKYLDSQHFERQFYDSTPQTEFFKKIV
jgi:hypothetical protein